MTSWTGSFPGVSHWPSDLVFSGSATLLEAAEAVAVRLGPGVEVEATGTKTAPDAGTGHTHNKRGPF